ncbi:Aegerolysin-domain-containing protein [Aspergillus egyptiacus]|nr:Aegerolysin-domain-containing protein [Aspergillus egyptiacus]
MTYNEWICINNGNDLSQGEIRTRDTQMAFGKFYDGRSKDKEIAPREINKIVIPVQLQAQVSACGRRDDPSGTEGAYTLYTWDGTRETRICTVDWDAPWGGAPPTVHILDPNTSGYLISKVQPHTTMRNVELAITKLG